MTDTAEAPDGFDFPLPFETEAPVADPSTTSLTNVDQAPGISTAMLRLPPLTNRYIVAVAGAPIFTSDEVEGLADRDVGLNPDRRGDLDARFASVVQQANSAYFQFELSQLHGPDDPTVITIEHGDSLVSLTRDDSDRKLTVLVLVSLDGADSALITHPAAAEPQVIAPGGAVVFPSYLVPTVDLGGSGSLRAIVTHATGPAFR